MSLDFLGPWPLLFCAAANFMLADGDALSPVGRISMARHLPTRSDPEWPEAVRAAPGSGYDVGRVLTDTISSRRGWMVGACTTPIAEKATAPDNFSYRVLDVVIRPRHHRRLHCK
ncbi:hypothetical protein [Rhodococcus koreensis]|uniref:hypothetical protein n=1 Tax=Rhodococcus koreensis TaxID=99653 RepID=UPI0036DA13DA